MSESKMRQEKSAAKSVNSRAFAASKKAKTKQIPLIISVSGLKGLILPPQKAHFPRKKRYEKIGTK